MLGSGGAGRKALRTRIDTLIDGSVIVLECAFSINLAALTLEQVCVGVPYANARAIR